MPCVVLQGPRQSGKTTLARRAFPDHAYISLENPDQRRFANEDPRGFLDTVSREPGAILDEIQRVPELFSWLQERIDQAPHPGRYILTGSQNYLVSERVSQSLAGRVRLLRLMPFGWAEVPDAMRPRSSDEALVSGLFPRIVAGGASASTWLPDYVETYLERDVRSLQSVGDLNAFHRFLQLCAGRSGQLLNLHSLAADAGVSAPTAKAWLSVLEAGFAVHQLLPWHVNLGKRLTKTPKLYFWDTGLACALLGIRSASDLASHPLRGALFETFVVSEFHKTWLHRGAPPDFHFWRDAHGMEIDLLLPSQGRTRPVEIKAGKTVQSEWLRVLGSWTELAGDRAAEPLVIYGGDERQKRSGAEVVGWTHLAGFWNELANELD
jgi:uncharacterized protein